MVGIVASSTCRSTAVDARALASEYGRTDFGVHAVPDNDSVGDGKVDWSRSLTQSRDPEEVQGEFRALKGAAGDTGEWWATGFEGACLSARGEGLPVTLAGNVLGAGGDVDITASQDER